MLKNLNYILLLFFLIPNTSYSAFILKIKEDKALIKLQGLKTYEGAYFRIYNLDNTKTGLLKIDKIAHTVAIGTLKVGFMNRRWNLQSISKKTALLELTKASKKETKLALIHKEKMKRKIAEKKSLDRKIKLAEQKILERKRKIARQKALERKRKIARQKTLERKRKIARQKALERKRKIANKKRNLSRKIASFTLNNDILNDLEGLTDNDIQSKEILNYPKTDSSNEANQTQDSSAYSTQDSTDYPTVDLEQINSNTFSNKSFQLGLRINPQFNFMRARPENNDEYDMIGVGGGIHLQSFISYNSFLDIGASLGYRFFDVSTDNSGDTCLNDKGCDFKIHYISGMAHLKLNLLKFKKYDFWILAEGSLMRSLSFSHNVPGLNEEEIANSLQGTLGGTLGFDFKFDRWIIPLSINGSIHMPLSDTTLLLTGGLQTGIRYKF
ncbi:MAG: hypothetical protein GDA46_06520 [Bdellovibrionales bacterium]|nr:hypothetical protein [Bdellovibrionales bacterium]